MSDFSAPAGQAEEVTLGGGDVTVDPPSRAVYVGGGGTLEVDMKFDDVDITFTNVPAGAILPIQITRIDDGNSTVSGVIILR